MYNSVEDPTTSPIQHRCIEIPESLQTALPLVQAPLLLDGLELRDSGSGSRFAA